MARPSKAVKKAPADQTKQSSLGQPRRSAAFLLPLLVFLGNTFLLAKHLHERLPTPVSISTDPSTGYAVFSEREARSTTADLSREYRIVGTQEYRDSEIYVLDLLKRLQRDLESSEFAKTHQLDISYQNGTAAHLFDFIGKPVQKSYHGLTNIVARVSSKQNAASRNDAVLINAHLDSTVSSPGAADDAASCAVMLELIRVLLGSPEELHHSVIFLFNGAEESLQDGSHLFITQHEWRDTVRTVINLEAVGTGGREIVFQATSKEMIRAYSNVPHPYGTVLANEIFSTGIIVSDTDFRQFELYGNLTGLDMAWVKNSYLYHTDRDRIENLGHGSLQNMGDNLVALMRQLTSASFELRDFDKSRETVFFSIFGSSYFVVASFQQALALYGTLLALISALAWTVAVKRPGSFLLACLSIPLSLIGSVIGAVSCKMIMANVLRKTLSWYRNELFPVALFGPSALLGMFATQLVLHQASIVDEEHTVFSAEAFLFSFLAFIGQACGIGSSYLFGLLGISLSVAWAVNAVINRRGSIHVSTHFFAACLPLLLGAEGLISFLDLFVPLGGRMGQEDADRALAVIVAVFSFTSMPMILPLAHRSPTVTRRVLAFLSLLSVASIAFFYRQAPFDYLHPRRTVVLHTENITSIPATHTLHFATIDSAPGFGDTVESVVDGLGLDKASMSSGMLNDHIPDYDFIFPVSQFLKTYKIPIPNDLNSQTKSKFQDTFQIKAISSSTNAIKRTRQLSLEVTHPDVLWTVIAFDAYVLSWSLPVKPAQKHFRHHIKEVSGHAVDRWTLDLTLQLDEANFEAALRYAQRAKGQRPIDEVESDPSLGRLKIDVSGLIESDIYRAKKEKYTGGSKAMDTFKTIDGLLPDSVE